MTYLAINTLDILYAQQTHCLTFSESVTVINGTNKNRVLKVLKSIIEWLNGKSLNEVSYIYDVEVKFTDHPVSNLLLECPYDTDDHIFAVDPLRIEKTKGIIIFTDIDEQQFEQYVIDYPNIQFILIDCDWATDRYKTVRTDKYTYIYLLTQGNEILSAYKSLKMAKQSKKEMDINWKPITIKKIKLYK